MLAGTSSVWVVRKTAVPETRASGASSQVARKEASGTASLASRIRTNRLPVRQVVRIVNTTIPITSGNQPPLGIFRVLAPNSARSTVMIGTSTTAIVGHCQRQTPRMTAAARTVVMAHRPGDCKAIGRSECARALEPQDQSDNRNQQQPIDLRDIDLTVRTGRGLKDIERRHQAELIACRDSENAPEITACDAMTVAAVDSSTSGNKPQSGAMRKNGFSIAVLSPRISAPCPK